MANEEHLALLKQGVWNEWRTENKLRYVVPDLSGANLSGLDLKSINFSFTNLRNTNLRGADLRGADFRKARINEADLRETDLREALFDQGVKLSGANLVRANLSGLVLAEADLYLADLEEADLSEADLERAVLVEAKLSKANLKEANLSAADLSDADLNEASLIRAELVGSNLSVASLRGANLTGANLASGQARSTDFTEAIFTGACIEDWHINSSTKLDAVDCQYVYMKYGLSASDPTEIAYRERRPSSGEFAPGDFTKLFQKSLKTIDFILRNPDWEAFVYSFRKIQIENVGETLDIQSIENKDDGVVVVKVNVSPNTDKERVHAAFVEGYQFAHNFLEARYRSDIDLKNGEIERQQGYINSLFSLLSQKTGVQKAMAENQKFQQTFHISGPITGFAGNIEGNQNNYAPEQRQNLAEAAAEIQQLLDQLARANPTSSGVVAEAIHQEIKRNPTLKARLVSALKAGGLEALKAIFNHPLFSIPAETVKGWLEAE